MNNGNVIHFNSFVVNQNEWNSIINLATDNYVSNLLIKRANLKRGVVVMGEALAECHPALGMIH
jgi:transcription termination factor Rho